MKKSLIYVMCLLIAVLMSVSTATAQTRRGTLTANSTTAEINKYFSDNILLLDPIEGVYSVEEVTKAWNDYRTFPDETDNFHMLILKKGDGYYTNIGNATTLKIRRVGETNAYDTETRIHTPNGYIWMSKRIVLENGLSFSYSLDLPIPNDGVGSRVRINNNYFKTYPTTSMYEDAVAAEVKRIQEEQEKVTDWSGSGFALNNGYLCTNYHVVDEAKSIRIFGVQGDFTTSYSAKVVASDKVNDLAILKVDDADFSGFGTIPYNVKTTMDEVGEDIFVLGYPLTATMGDEIKLTTGVISARTGFQGDVSMYQISAPIQPGNSGGPLFDSKGDLVGIVSARHTGAENVGYAVKASYLRNLMESSLAEDILPKNNTISSQPLTSKVSKVKNLVYYIKCSSEYLSYIDVKKPHVDYSPKGFTIKKVRVTDTQTIVDVEWECVKSGFYFFYIPQTTHIKTSDTTYTLIEAQGIPIAPNSEIPCAIVNYDEKRQHTLIFPAIPKETARFDLVEGSELSSMKFYGVSLNAIGNQYSSISGSKNHEEFKISESSNINIDVKSPYIDSVTGGEGVKITRVRVTDAQTIVDFEETPTGSELCGVYIPPTTYIRTDDRTYTLLETIGISMPPAFNMFEISSLPNGKLKYSLIFPVLPEETTKFDLIEESEIDSGSKGYYGINLLSNEIQDNSDGENIEANEGSNASEDTVADLDVTNPYVRKSSEGLTIKRVRVNDEQTVVDFEYDNGAHKHSHYGYYSWFNISSSTYIVTDAGIELKLTKADGISIAPERHYLSKREVSSFTLVFPALPENTTKFDLIERTKSGWEVRGIVLSTSKNTK